MRLCAALPLKQTPVGLMKRRNDAAATIDVQAAQYPAHALFLKQARFAEQSTGVHEDRMRQHSTNTRTKAASADLRKRMRASVGEHDSVPRLRPAIEADVDDSCLRRFGGGRAQVIGAQPLAGVTEAEIDNRY